MSRIPLAITVDPSAHMGVPNARNQRKPPRCMHFAQASETDRTEENRDKKYCPRMSDRHVEAERMFNWRQAMTLKPSHFETVSDLSCSKIPSVSWNRSFELGNSSALIETLVRPHTT